MSTWSPNAQLAALQFSGLLAFVLALYFLYYITLNAVLAFAPDSSILTSKIFEHAPLVPAILGIALMLRYTLQLKQMNAGGWRSMLMILKDEYAVSIYRVAAAKAFMLSFYLCFAFFYLSLLGFGSTSMDMFLNAQTVSATLIFAASLVFGFVVLAHLREEDA